MKSCIAFDGMSDRLTGFLMSLLPPILVAAALMICLFVMSLAFWGFMHFASEGLRLCF